MLGVAAVALATFLLAANVAHANGDPASDYLLSDSVFFPAQDGPSGDLAEQLTGATADAKRKGYPIKVALIAAPTDLGDLGPLFRMPQPYARLLAREVWFAYQGRLLVVMPNGFGLEHVGHPTGTEKRALAGLTVEPGGDGLARAAITAVRRLAATKGVNVRVPPPEDSSWSPSHTTLLVVVAGLSMLLTLAVGVLVVLARQRRRGVGED